MDRQRGFQTGLRLSQIPLGSPSHKGRLHTAILERGRERERELAHIDAEYVRALSTTK